MKSSNVLFKGLLAVVLAVGLMSFRTIKTVERVEVEPPVGTAPRLPFQVWVTYSDGSGEWRQVRWTTP